MLARMEKAMMPKKRYLETGAAVKPEASIPIYHHTDGDEEG